MSVSKKGWYHSPPKPVKPKAPDAVKVALTEKADKLIEEVFKPKHIQPVPTDYQFNYLADIFLKWYRSYFYICGTYNCPHPDSILSSFEVKFARMQYTHEGKYDVSWMRHTGQWCEIYQGLDEDECLKLIAEEPYFIS